MGDYFWDFLRPLTDFAGVFDPYIKIIVLLFAFAIFVVSLFAYRKSKSKKLLLVTIAFFLFALKWLTKVFDIFVSPGNFLSDASENVFEFLILLSLFSALFRK